MDAERRSNMYRTRHRKRPRDDSQQHLESQTKLKKRIRDVQRLLNLDTLKANVRRDHEQELASLKHQLNNAVRAFNDARRARRYQMVRFFERKKATRKLKRAQKLHLDNPSAESKELVDKYTLDLYYTTHFPLTEKYLALYPNSVINREETLLRRQQIREKLREEMLQEAEKLSGSNKVELGKRKTIDSEEEGSEESSSDSDYSDSDEDPVTKYKYIN